MSRAFRMNETEKQVPERFRGILRHSTGNAARVIKSHAIQWVPCSAHMQTCLKHCVKLVPGALVAALPWHQWQARKRKKQVKCVSCFCLRGWPQVLHLL